MSNITSDANTMLEFAAMRAFTLKILSDGSQLTKNQIAARIASSRVCTPSHRKHFLLGELERMTEERLLVVQHDEHWLLYALPARAS